MAAGPPFELREGLLQRIKQAGTSADGDAATYNDDFGVEHIDKRSNGGCEMANGGEPDFGGVFIVSTEGVEQGEGRDITPFAALGDGLITNGSFKAAGGVEIIARGIRIDGEVTEMPCPADFAFQQASAAPDRAADPGAEREHEGVLRVLRSSGPDFSEQCRVGIIQHAAITLKKSGPRELFEPVHATRHPVDAMAFRIRQSGCGESDAELLPGLRLELMHDLTHGEGEARRVAVKFAIAGGFGERGEGAGAGRVHERGLDVRAAEIDADGKTHEIELAEKGERRRKI